MHSLIRNSVHIRFILVAGVISVDDDDVVVVYLMTGPHRNRGVTFQHFGVVLFTDEVAVDDGVPIAWHEPLVTRHTRKTVHVVHIALRAHHELLRGDILRTRCTRPA